MPISRNVFLVFLSMVLTLGVVSCIHYDKEVIRKEKNGFTKPNIVFEGVSREYNPKFNNISQGKAWILIQAPEDLRKNLFISIKNMLTSAEYRIAGEEVTKAIIRDFDRTGFLEGDIIQLSSSFFNAATDRKQWERNDIIVFTKLSCYQSLTSNPRKPGYFKSRNIELKALYPSSKETIWNIRIDRVFTENIVSRNEFIGAIEKKIAAELSSLQGQLKFVKSNNTPAGESGQLSSKGKPTVILDPQNKETTETSIFLTGWAIDSEGIRNVRVIANEKEIRRSIEVAKSNQPDKRKIRIEHKIELKLGQNIIRVVAVNTNGVEAEESLFITNKQEIGVIHAVVIGIDDFQSDRIRDLKFAENDAIAFEKYLKNNLRVPVQNIETLTNKSATLEKIRRALLTNLVKREKRSDKVIIYWAGHGLSIPDSSSLDGDGFSKYLAVVDSDPTSYEATALPMEEIRRVFQKIEAERVVFFVDTCFSGASGGRTILMNHSTRSGLDDDFMTRLIPSRKGRIIMAASRANQLSQETDELQHGVFTYFLLKGLKGDVFDVDGDGSISTDELAIYVEKEVAAYTDNKQVPVKKGEGNVIVGKK
ncbi:caspase family protein [bacterium]|nr:caspase family protein [bacterium]